MQKNYEPTLVQVQTRGALHSFYAGMGHKPDEISYEEKRAVADRQMKARFTASAGKLLRSLGFKVSL